MNVRFDNNNVILKGSINLNELETILEKYIEIHVLCKKCDNPETTLRLSKNKKEYVKDCIACGERCRYLI